MVKKLIIGLISVLFIISAAACGNTTKKEDSGKMPEMVEVHLSVNPDKAEPNQQVTFEAKVTQGSEAVTDADEVVFEIWRSKDENHEKIKVKHAENGIYRLEKSFTQEGTYYFVSHVTARNMHNMPKTEFTVGTPSEPEAPSTQGTMDNMEMDQDEGH
ncbi:FixH family protein [Neobacillus sp. LXY-1]|uniref:FixH family protein n=1 Tax=Neobacillus sp. LXY-1 TaxID=3379133 RepID=UPI003EE3BBDA